MDTSNKSRRAVIRTGLGLVAAGTVAVAGARAQDQKIAQALVQYQPTPKDGVVCVNCANWVAPNACKIVEGVINPQGWCIAYGPKEG